MTACRLVSAGDAAAESLDEFVTARRVGVVLALVDDVVPHSAGHHVASRFDRRPRVTGGRDEPTGSEIGEVDPAVEGEERVVGARRHPTARGKAELEDLFGSALEDVRHATRPEPQILVEREHLDLAVGLGLPVMMQRRRQVGMLVSAAVAVVLMAAL